jgi:hypothetical protein
MEKPWLQSSAPPVEIAPQPDASPVIAVTTVAAAAAAAPTAVESTEADEDTSFWVADAKAGQAAADAAALEAARATPDVAPRTCSIDGCNSYACTFALCYAHGVEYCARVFTLADKSGDGELSKSELKNYFKTSKSDKDLLCGTTFTWVKFFAGMDVDGSGTFDLNEFTGSVVKV